MHKISPGSGLPVPSIAEVIRTLREIAPPKVRALAQASGVPYTTLMSIRSGKVGNPGIATVGKFLPLARVAAEEAAFARADAAAKAKAARARAAAKAAKAAAKAVAKAEARAAAKAARAAGA